MLPNLVKKLKNGVENLYNVKIEDKHNLNNSERYSYVSNQIRKKTSRLIDNFQLGLMDKEINGKDLTDLLKINNRFKGLALEKPEERIHFSLLLISLLSLYGISYLLSSLIIKERRFRLLGVLIITASFLTNETWVGYSVIHVHPDLLLSFLSGLFCYFIYHSLLCPDKEMYYYAAIIGGLALSTKMSFILFLPGLLFFKIPPLNTNNIKKLIKFYLLIAISYFLVGFPQNFKIRRMERVIIK